MLGQDILSELGLITDCGNGIVWTPGSKQIFAPDSIVKPARKGTQLEFFVPVIENGDIILFPLSYLFTDKSLSIGHAIAHVNEHRVNVIMANFSNKSQTPPAGITVALVEPVDNQWIEADEQKATKQYFLAQDSSDQYETAKTKTLTSRLSIRA